MIISDLSVTIEALASCGYEKIINESEANSKEYHWKFERAAGDALNKEELAQSAALQLLSFACSLMLNSSDPKMPFAPFAIGRDGTTSVKPIDFSEEQINLLSEFSIQIEHPELAARLADLVWVIRRNFIAAKTAITNYIQSSDSSYCQKNWFARIERLERALRLSLLINENDAVEIIKNRLIQFLAPDHSLYSLIATKKIYSLLLEFRLLDPILLGEKILLSINSQSEDDKGGFQYELFSIANKAFLKGKDLKRANSARISAAESLVKKAELEKQSGKMIVSSHWLSQAINIFQQCEGQQHRVIDLQKEIKVVNKECQKEMKQFSISYDITDAVRKATLAMQDKDLTEAIVQFAYMSAPLRCEGLKMQVIEIAQSTVFQATAEKRILNGDDKLVAIIPPLIGSEGKDYDLALRWGCYQQAAYEHSFIVQGKIIPARNELLKLHQVDEGSLFELLKNCAFFPAERAFQWVKGFILGFYDNFDSALCLLIPQFEQALRKNLESRGAVVWRVDPITKFHSEKNLGELLSLPEACEFLGENLQFELQGLLTERVGFNFRNEALHGLASESAFYSPSAVYLWWLLFHIVIRLSQFSFGSVYENGNTEAVCSDFGEIVKN
ncbi:MAG TPA: DUF4209 domain-containing protein [Coxiellaceae bacterium]|nr:DUF4209 domain-containing protein [Coxiellaceae bacterium]